VVLAGVVAAAVLGVGLGLWARPAPEPPPQPRPPTPAVAAPEPRLQIVVDDTPAPIGVPLEVLPPDMIAAAGTSRARAAPVDALPPMAPARPAPAVQRLVKASATPAPVDADRSASRSPSAKPKASRTGTLKASRSGSSQAKTGQATPPKARIDAKAQPTKLAKAKAAKAQQAKSPAAKSRKPAQQAEARTARSKPKPKPEASPARRLPGEASTRVARADPPDRRLEVRERQLQRAYAQAEAAGVSAQTLRRQQARWVEARNAAEREAPWAVEDVYLARISELHDLTRDARDP
jgi:hypothetical protein